MSVPPYTVNGASFEAAQITGAVLTTNVMANDTLDLTQALGDIADALLFSSGSYVSLCQGATQIFYGRAVPRTRASRTRLERPYRILGGWSELARRVYAQPWTPYTGAAVNYGRVGLNWSGDAVITTGAQIRAAVQWAINHGAQITLGTVDEGIEVVPEYAADRTCAEVIMRQLEYTPDHIPQFDYSTTPPTFHCRAVSSFVSATLPLAMFADGVDCYHSYETEITGLVMNVKYQELPDEEEEVPEGEEGAHRTRFVTVATSGAVLGNEGVLSFSFDGADYEDVEQFLTTQGAALLAAVQTFGWSGGGTTKGNLPPLYPAVGQKLNITNGEPGWLTMEAVVQSSRRDLLMGTNSATWGPPRKLSVGDMVGLMARRRRRENFVEGLREEQAAGITTHGQHYGYDGKAGEKSQDAGGDIEDIIIDFNGSARYCTLKGTIGDPV